MQHATRSCSSDQGVDRYIECFGKDFSETNRTVDPILRHLAYTLQTDVFCNDTKCVSLEQLWDGSIIAVTL